MKIKIIIILALLVIISISKGQTQADSSDAYWTIVVPTPKSIDINLQKCLIRSSKDSVISDFVQNIGSWKFRVDSIYIRGLDADVFSITSGLPKYYLEPGNNHFAEFRFAPTEARVYNAEIVIITQADTLIQNISGEGIGKSLEIITNYIDFGEVNIGKFKDTLQSVTIKNVSSTAVNITETKHNYPNAIDFTTITGGGDFILQPNESKLMDLRFTPSDIGRTSGTLEFHYIGFGSPAVIQLFGEGVNKRPIIQSEFSPFDDLLCESEGINYIEIKNKGENDLIINELNLRGSNSNDFLINQTFPITILQDSILILPITFRPQSPGQKIADLEIISNAYPDSVLNLQISATKINTDFEINSKSIDFGNLKINEQSIKNLIIKNPGTLQTSYSLEISGNLQLSEQNFTLIPNEGKEISIFFAGSPETIKVNETLKITENTCNQVKTVPITLIVYKATAEIQTTELQGYPGDEIEVPIILNSSENLSLAGVNSINAELIFNPTLLAPIGYNVENIDNNTAKIKIENLPISSNIGSTLANMKFIVGLGNAESCDLIIENAETVGGFADISLINGKFTLLGICEEGGSRLINPAKITKLMQISPNPSDGNVQIGLNLVEKGNTILKVFSVSGELIEEMMITNQSGNINIELDTKNYGNGLYFIQLQTPTVNKIDKLIIFR